jgi:hypothetical protein
VCKHSSFKNVLQLHIRYLIVFETWMFICYLGNDGSIEFLLGVYAINWKNKPAGGVLVEAST